MSYTSVSFHPSIHTRTHTQSPAVLGWNAVQWQITTEIEISKVPEDTHWASVSHFPTQQVSAEREPLWCRKAYARTELVKQCTESAKHTQMHGKPDRKPQASFCFGWIFFLFFNWNFTWTLNSISKASTISFLLFFSHPLYLLMMKSIIVPPNPLFYENHRKMGASSIERQLLTWF